MAQSKNREVREFDKFIESPSRPGKSAVEVVGQIEIEENLGTWLPIYDEANSVAGLATATIINYTVPAGKELKTRTIDVSGDNVAKYFLEVDGNTEDTKRTYYTYFNETFELHGQVYGPGVNIKIIVENRRNSTADFNAKILGVLQDA